MTSDIRKWFMKQHDKGNGAASKPPAVASSSSKTVEKDEDDKKRKKTSKYFPAKPKEEPKEEKKTPPKRKPLKVKEESDDDNDFEVVKGKSAKKKLKVVDVSDEDDDEDMEEEENLKARGRGGRVRGRGGGRGGKTPEKKLKVEELLDEEDDEDVEEKGGNSKGRGGGGAGRGRGRGRGGGRGGFMNFGERKDPPHKGEKDVPEGAPNCLTGLTFVISGTLDSLEREEAEDLIKRHGGRVTGSVSKKTNFLLADEDIGGRKSAKAKELGTSFLTEDGLFDMIRKSKPIKTPVKEASTKKSPEKFIEIETKDDRTIKSVSKVPPKISISPIKRKVEGTQVTWTEKYKPAVPNDIVGNQSLVKQLHEWLAHWDEQFLHTSQKEKGKKKSDANSKKAVLLSGSPGIGKTTSAKLVSKMLGFQAIEVNASDNRGKADAKIFKGVGGSAANSIKELISNESINVGNDWSKHQKTVLIMDEVDGMSAGDRGGVADLIASIKVSKIPIICICNDRYSQKLKSLVNYCLPLNYRKPTKQQMAKRLSYIAKAEGIQVNEIALEELADRVSGDMRMAINQLQYMSLSLPVINYDDVRARLLNSAKDEDISPFSAVDKLFGFNGGKLRMDERIDLSMSDPDLVPLIIQENYINYRPVSGGRDDNGVKRMNMLAKAAESIGDGDLINVQIRRYRQWQLMQSSSIASCIIPASLMHGNRETLEQGERNYNRFGGWLGKNSTRGKNLRLLEDVHVHFLASQHSSLDRDALRVDYFPLLLTQMTHPLREMAKEKAVHNVVEFMDTYSLNLEDFDSIIELSKFQGHTSPLDGVPPAVKGALTRAYKEGSSCRVIRSADMVNIPGVKKAPKKRIAAMLEEPADLAEEKNEEELASDADDADEAEDGELDMLRSDLQSVKSKGIVVDLELKGSSGSLKKSTGAKTSRAESAGKSGGGARGGKRKR